MLWCARQSSTEDLGRCVKAQLLKDVALACCEPSRLHFASKASSMNDERVSFECTQDGLCGGTSFLGGRIVGDVLPIDSLE